MDLPRPRPAVAGVLWMLLATLMFVSVNAIVKWLSDSLATPQILFARYAFQLLLLAMLMRGGFARALSTRRFGLQFLRGVLMMGTLGLSFAAIRYIPLADASAVMFLVPVMITALRVGFESHAARANLRTRSMTEAA